jgi:hypothetical protein
MIKREEWMVVVMVATMMIIIVMIVTALMRHSKAAIAISEYDDSDNGIDIEYSVHP